MVEAKEDRLEAAPTPQGEAVMKKEWVGDRLEAALRPQRRSW